MTDPSPQPSTLESALARAVQAEELLVALDFDGTISLHADNPMDARMLPAAAAAVGILARLPRTHVAFVSGRSLADLRIIAEHGDDSPVLTGRLPRCGVLVPRRRRR